MNRQDGAKPKLLYVITQGAWGGAQKYVFDLATSLSRDFDITVAIGESDGNNHLQKKLSAITDHGSTITVIQLRHLIRPIHPLHDLSALFELRQLYKKIKPDIIHLNSSKASILGSLASWYVIRDTCYVIYTAHGWVFEESLSPLRRALYRLLEQWTARLKNRIIVLSEQDKQTARENLHIPEAKLALIPLGIEAAKNAFTKEQAREKILSMQGAIRDTGYGIRDTWVGTIAGLYKTKGVDILLQAIKILTDHRSPITDHFFIIGSGPEENALRLKIENLKIENSVHLLGYIENASQLLPAFDLFVLPSRKEGAPYTLLEAMAHNVPAVATDVGGISSLIEHKKSGLIVPPENPQALAEAMTYALENPEEMRRMAASVAIVAAKSAISAMTEKTIALYSSLLAPQATKLDQ